MVGLRVQMPELHTINMKVVVCLCMLMEGAASGSECLCVCVFAVIVCAAAAAAVVTVFLCERQWWRRGRSSSALRRGRVLL